MNLISSLFSSVALLETKKPLKIEGLVFFFLIPKICVLQLGKGQKLMVHTQVNSRKAEFTAASTMFSFSNDENSRKVFSLPVSCILAINLCYKVKAMF